MHSRVSNLRSRYIVRYRGWAKTDRLAKDDEYPLQDRFLIYTDYAPYGTIKGIMEGVVKSGKYVPESLIWFCFHALAGACVVLRHLERTNGNAALEEEEKGDQIVHGDLKDVNIFLNYERDDSQWPAYPTLQLGDFGQAFVTSVGDQKNPGSDNEIGTPGNQPYVSTDNTPQRYKF